MYKLNYDSNDKYAILAIKLLCRFLKECGNSYDIPFILKGITKRNKEVTLISIGRMLNSELDWARHPDGSDYMYRKYAEFSVLLFIANILHGKDDFHNCLLADMREIIELMSLPEDRTTIWWKECQNIVKLFWGLDYVSCQNKVSK